MEELRSVEMISVRSVEKNGLLVKTVQVMIDIIEG